MILFLLSLFICIVLHELGHFFAAKSVKCKVERLSLGFGPVLLRKKMGETSYEIALIPLGGFCSLKNELTYSRSKYAFTNLSYRKKLLITIAGCAVNILTGIIAIGLAYVFKNFSFVYFGIVSISLGITNLLPIPALDGSYPFLVLLEKKYGKKKGYAKMEKIVTFWFKILLIVNIATIPLVIYWYKIGALSLGY